MKQEEIVADYALSHAWGCSVEGEWAMKVALPESVRPHIDPDVLTDWCSAPEEQLRETFRRVEAEHGSLTAYLDSIGIDSSIRDRVREQLAA